MSMDKALADYYGTNQEDVEKTAAAEMAEQLAEGEQIDLDQVDPETLEEMAAAVLSEDEDGETADGDEGEEDYAQEKIAEDYAHADRMGRIMAHAYVQELRGIEKEASRVGKHLENVGKGVFGKVMRTGGAEKAMNPLTAKAIGAGVYGTGAATAGGLGVVAKKAFGKKKEKKASAESQTPHYDTLVQMRAAEILQANGIDPETLEPVEGEEKTAALTGADVLAAKVEQDAAALLEELGFQFAEE